MVPKQQQKAPLNDLLPPLGIFRFLSGVFFNQILEQKGYSFCMKILLYLILITAVLCAIRAFFIEPDMLCVKIYKISEPKLKGMKIVYASDFHIAPGHKKRLQNIVDEINRQKPDLVLLGGDYVKGHKEKSSMPVSDIAKALQKIEAKYGVYGVMGNHDWFTDGQKAADILEKHGIKILQNENILITAGKQKVYLAGLEDMYMRQADLQKALAGAGQPVILLSHEPDIYPDVPEYVTLTLAGHMHGGQVQLPFLGALIVPSPMGRKYAQGYFTENGRKMIISSGLGTSLLPLRFNVVPEIVVIEFE